MYENPMLIKTCSGKLNNILKRKKWVFLDYIDERI